jgi:lysophospholipase L1-like esterase
MPEISRRNFLKQLGVLAALSLAGKEVFADSFLSDLDNSGNFEFLVIGDSLVFGQGLKEENKFYTLTRNWLQNDVFGSSKNVNLKVKAHSGASITLHEREKNALKKAELDETKFYKPEVNFNFPTIWTQVDIAKKEYASPDSVNLIMLTGGITDLGVADILNVFGSEKAFREAIPKFCNESMFRLLEHAANTFPNALIAVVGYFPMVSKKSSTHAVFNAILELYEFPRFTKPLLNNLLTLPLLKMIRKQIIKRSKCWVENSDIELNKAVTRLNNQLGKQQAVFIKSPITEENCFGTKKSLLWEMKKKGRSEDDLYDERAAACKKEIYEFNKTTGVKYKIRFCELSGLGHPNNAGSKAYAEAIKEKLEPLLSSNAKLKMQNGKTRRNI